MPSLFHVFLAVVLLAVIGAAAEALSGPRQEDPDKDPFRPSRIYLLMLAGLTLAIAAIWARSLGLL